MTGIALALALGQDANVGYQLPAGQICFYG
jgi:hypothetical protein